MKLKRTCAIFILLCIASSLHAIAPRLTKDTTLNGVRMKLPPNAIGQTLKTLQVFRYTRTRTSGNEDVITQLECFSPSEVWYREQYLGEWQDRSDNTYRFAKLASLPGAYPREHLTKDEYQEVQKNAPVLGENWTAWVEAFLNEAPTTEKALRGNPNMVRCAFYATDTRFLLVFQFKAHETPFAFEITPSENKYFKPTEKLLQQTLVRSLSWRGEKQSPLRSGSSLSRAGGFRQHASRDAAKQSIANSSNWFSLDSPDYVLITNLRKNNTRMAKAMLDQLQIMRKAYDRYFHHTPTPQDEVSVVRVFANPEEYVAYVGEGSEWSSGLFSSSHRELVIQGNEDVKSSKRNESIRTILFHEGFHQYLFLATGGKPIPIWFNEGHATFFESARISSSTKAPTIRMNEMRLRGIKAMTSYPIKALMLMDQETFYNGGTDRDRLENYALSWGITSFMRMAETSKTAAAKPYTTFAIDYYHAACQPNATEQSIFDALFTEKYNFADFETAVTRYLDKVAKK